MNTKIEMYWKANTTRWLRKACKKLEDSTQYRGTSDGNLNLYEKRHPPRVEKHHSKNILRIKRSFTLLHATKIWCSTWCLKKRRWTKFAVESFRRCICEFVYLYTFGMCKRMYNRVYFSGKELKIVLNLGVS